MELLLSLLELDAQKIEVNLAQGEQRSPRFLTLNPFGQVPVLEDGETAISDSNAILVYLDSAYGGRRYTPSGADRAAALQRWLSVAAGPLASSAAAARAHALFNAPVDLPTAQSRARALFRVMNSHLEQQPYLLGAALSLADIANYAYVARAPEGGIALDEYPQLQDWLSRIEATPRFIPMPAAIA